MSSSCHSNLPSTTEQPLRDLCEAWCLLRDSLSAIPSHENKSVDDWLATYPFAALCRVIRSEEHVGYSIVRASPSVHQLFGYDVDGATLEQINHPQMVDRVRDMTREVVETKHPHFWDRVTNLSNGQVLAFQRLALPLASDGERVDHLLMSMVIKSDPVPDFSQLAQFRF